MFKKWWCWGKYKCLYLSSSKYNIKLIKHLFYLLWVVKNLLYSFYKKHRKNYTWRSTKTGKDKRNKLIGFLQAKLGFFVRGKWPQLLITFRNYAQKRAVCIFHSGVNWLLFYIFLSLITSHLFLFVLCKMLQLYFF